MNSSFSCNCNCKCEKRVFRFKNVPFSPICSCCCLQKPQSICPPATPLYEESVCKIRREAFEAGNVHFFDNPDPFGVDYEYYFVNELANALQPCNDLPGFSRSTIEELDLIKSTFLVDGKPLCPMLVWGIVNGEPMLINVDPLGGPANVVPTPSLFCKAYRICVRPVFT